MLEYLRGREERRMKGIQDNGAFERKGREKDERRGRC